MDITPLNLGIKLCVKKIKDAPLKTEQTIGGLYTPFEGVEGS